MLMCPVPRYCVFASHMLSIACVSAACQLSPWAVRLNNSVWCLRSSRRHRLEQTGPATCKGKQLSSRWYVTRLETCFEATLSLLCS